MKECRGQRLLLRIGHVSVGVSCLLPLCGRAPSREKRCQDGIEWRGGVGPDAGEFAVLQILERLPLTRLATTEVYDCSFRFFGSSAQPTGPASAHPRFLHPETHMRRRSLILMLCHHLRILPQPRIWPSKSQVRRHGGDEAEGT